MKVTKKWIGNFLDYMPIPHSILTAKNEIHSNRKECLDYIIEKFKEKDIEVEE